MSGSDHHPQCFHHAQISGTAQRCTTFAHSQGLSKTLRPFVGAGLAQVWKIMGAVGGLPVAGFLVAFLKTATLAYQHRRERRKLLEDVLLGVKPDGLCTRTMAAVDYAAPRNRNDLNRKLLFEAVEEMVLAVWAKASRRSPITFCMPIPDLHWLYSTVPSHPLLAIHLAKNRSGAFRGAVRKVNTHYGTAGGLPDCLLTAWSDSTARAAIVTRVPLRSSQLLPVKGRLSLSSSTSLAGMRATMCVMRRSWHCPGVVQVESML